MPKRGGMRLQLTQNILWAIVCITLVIIIGALLRANDDLRWQTNTLKHSLATTQTIECVARDAWAAGTTKSFAIESGGLTRHYLVHLPEQFNPQKSYPAVLYFSGKGSSGTESHLTSSYNQLPAVLIYPDPTIGKDGITAWQGAPYSSTADDVMFVHRMLDQISGQLCLERSHIYAVGVSNGGGFVALLSCMMPDRIRAFGMIAGAYYPESNCQPKQPAPIITIHGDNDAVVPYAGSLARRLPDIDTWSVQRAAQNNCKQPPFISHQHAATLTAWNTCERNAAVHSLKQHGIGHAWTTVERDIIWRFLSSY